MLDFKRSMCSMWSMCLIKNLYVLWCMCLTNLMCSVCLKKSQRCVYTGPWSPTPCKTLCVSGRSLSSSGQAEPDIVVPIVRVAVGWPIPIDRDYHCCSRNPRATRRWAPYPPQRSFFQKNFFGFAEKKIKKEKKKRKSRCAAFPRAKGKRVKVHRVTSPPLEQPWPSGTQNRCP